MLRIRIAEDIDFNFEVVNFLRTFAQVDISGCSQDEVSQILKEYDVFWFRLGYQLGKNQIGETPRCKILATPVTGIDHIDEDHCKKIGVSIVCLRDEKEFLKEVRATAELTIALTLDLLRHTTYAQQDVLRGEWRRDLFRGNEIFNKCVGIIGYGRLGSITASYFEALGSEIYYTDVKEVNAPKKHKRLNSIAEIIDQCDIISIHVNYNKQTHHLINREELTRFTDTKYLINTSRGGLIEEDALLERLKKKKIAGAALDVVQNEHTWGEANPLLLYARKNRNLIITPHIGGNTYESFSKTEWFIAKKIKSLVSHA